MSELVVLATNNPTKLERLYWLVERLLLTPVPPTESGVDVAMEETGATHEENANLKAAAYSRAFDGLALASDGGLVIPALGDRWDSVHTSRSAGPEANDRQRADALLELMRGYFDEERRAYWVEAVAIAEKGRVLKTWTRRSRSGVIAKGYQPEQLVPGFWVFTLWWFPEIGKRYVNLLPRELERVEDHWTGLRSDVGEFFAKRPG